MKSVRKEWKVFMIATVFVFVFIVIGAISAPSVSAWDWHAKIVPIKSHPFGNTYGEWAAKWWQWALGTPARINPLFDATGEFCDAGQKGPVWFLASTLGYSGGEYGPVERDCTVPFGKSLFFPIINAGYFAFLNDDPEYRTEEFVRSMVDCTTPSLLNVHNRWCSSEKTLSLF